jgi:hypothetical protein
VTPTGAWTVGEERTGPIRLGMTLDELKQEVGPTLTAAFEGASCEFARLSDQPGLMIMLVDQRVARVDVTEGSLATRAGVRVGDTEARVQELYKGRVRVEPHKYTSGHYLIVDAGSGRRLIFETDGTRVTRYRAGAVPQVDWVEGCS